ncbi:MAG: hypothetical protein V7641_1924 [Blastocatellia bacterium]
MSAKFRAALKSELPLWIEEGFLSADHAKRLSETYQLEQLTAESSRLLSAVIFTIGGLLLGGGVIAFVAANWDSLATPLKLVLLFATLLGFHLTGYWLWHIRGWTRLGHALIFAGCLTFGANIGLIAQIFNIRGDWYGMFGAWALGSLAMAWAMRSWLAGLLVIFTSLLWFVGFQGDGHELSASAYPVALAAALIPLACLIRSRLLYAGTLLGVIVSAGVLAGGDDGGRAWLLAITAGGVFAWAVSELHRVTGWHREFANLTAGLGLSTLAVAAYLGSFQWLWETARTPKSFPFFSSLLLGLCIAALLWLWQAMTQARRWLLMFVSAVTVLLCGSLLLANWRGVAGANLFIVAANLAALSLAAALIGISLAEERRAVFWLGSLYVVLLILSRFLEYETSLLLKSAAFLACGIAVIIAGIQYEKYLRRKSLPADGDERKELAYE